MKKILKYMIPVVIVIITAQRSIAQVGVSITIAPPPLPVYTQPYCPGDGYIWIPGYWAYDDNSGYYWVPGEWVLPPEIGFYWTPGYWALADNYYVWHTGYWGPQVGFYGGINYGCGYFGTGFVGGLWQGHVFRYNTAVTRVNTAVVHNTYVNRTVINNTTIVNNRASFNGRGGVNAMPTPRDRLIAREHHVASTSVQLAQQKMARSDKNQFASVNHGRPERLFVEKPVHQGNTPAEKNNVTMHNSKMRISNSSNVHGNMIPKRQINNPAQKEQSAPLNTAAHTPQHINRQNRQPGVQKTEVPTAKHSETRQQVFHPEMKKAEMHEAMREPHMQGAGHDGKGRHK
ncbi:MAG TPA: YXWGXW repeat-containing protein [Chitinophagaceae bacterium]|nr:YXWGXW repeat-containing protein [Chitinophagaceae bacterium]